MRSWHLTFALIICAALARDADAQLVNRRKPKTTTNYTKESLTGVAVPDNRPYGTYVWREVYTCNATWFSDGKLRTCRWIDGTTRWRLESGGDFAERVFWDPGPGSSATAVLVNSYLLLVREKDVVTLVSLPSGRKTVTRHSLWIPLTTWWGGGPTYHLASEIVDGQPVTLSRVNEDGSVGPPIPGSDLRRYIREQDMPSSPCTSLSESAALPAEQSLDAIPGRPWTELRRMQIEDGVARPAVLSGDPVPRERCRLFADQFYIGRRASDGAWQLLDVKGQPTATATYASAEEATAQAARALRAKAAADVAALEEERRQKAARDSAAAALARRNAEEMQASVDRRQREADAFVAAGRFAEAYERVRPLSGKSRGRVVLAWTEAPVSMITEALQAIEEDRGHGLGWDSELHGALDRRRSALQRCEASYGMAQGAKTKWESTAPAERTMYMIQTRARVLPAPRSGLNLAFDATRYEWVWIDYHAPNDLINVPSPSAPAMQDRTQYDQCVREARAVR